ncbi:hypothetical protein Snas_1860 [Stackebrandtia nassauensis DSM 44728]|uniref:Uncharacterized protein n=1 Tax=Stackebrandtia nassauensis (strain DSM 44728 / CIP 108903 / NRRL B-16338 / NBRC 102104 / LLR-40K-21) TaxID=446470 RepID=D3PYI9_STANL|nr:hypothetical protein Snas_1860 [Stackebrandtia nassauensis DSM 44728]
MLSRRKGAHATDAGKVTPRTLTRVNATTTDRRSRPAGIVSLVLLAIAAAWLIVSFLSLRVLVAEVVKADSRAIATLITSMSGAVMGAVFGGTCAGHLARISRLGFLTRLPRLVTGAAAGVLVGVAAAGLAYYTFSGTPAVATIVAGVTGIAAIVGGCLAAPRNTDAVFAGLCGTVVVLVVMFARGWFAAEINSMMTPGSYQWVGIAFGVALGMLVGIAAVLVLRLRAPRTTLSGYLAAGAAPGALWLVSEVATRVAAGLLVAKGIEPDPISNLGMELILEAQLNGSLAALFTGGTTAVLAFGTLMSKGGNKKTGRGGKASVPSQTKATNTKSKAKR